jgi:hypothetical protein
MAFVRFIGELIRYDLFEGDFVHQIRQLQPQLFGEQPAPMVSRAGKIAMLGPATARAPLPLTPDER